ncbi:ATP-grasp ribosomal peptide maturase [Streptomyces sp. 8N616]|uniref:ATP-grasp ribosomal peptide maturase n=1 Tax=Streptomyces sp. 8N616 TaxID=3457414 RepID=UPI003FD2F953
MRALYHRRPNIYAADDDSQGAKFAAQENRRGLGGVLASLPGCLYLSHPQAIARTEYKPAQLATACRAGFILPATLITSDPAEAKTFTAEQPTIYKPLHAAAYEVDGEPAGIWAAPVAPGEIDETVSRCAHLFQAQVPKVADVRAVVVGTEVFCARITAPPGVVDWRAEYRNLSYEAVACPEEIKSALLQFLAAFGLRFGAFDFAVTADGTWWFLECNPNGQWAWLEAAADLPIAAAIADLLENGESPRD